MKSQAVASPEPGPELVGFGHAFHIFLVRAWRRFPWPGGRGRYWAKNKIFNGQEGRGQRFVPTNVGWLKLEWSNDLLQRTLYASGQHYESEVADWLAGQDLGGAHVLDVGAHAGYYTLALARAVGASGRVIAFEPQPRLARAVEAAIAANGLPWASVERAAVGDRDGDLEIHSPGDLGRSTAGALPDGTYASVTYPMYRLDRWIEEHLEVPPRLIKIDIEGAEWLALDGLHGVLSRAERPWLLIEVHPRQIRDLGGEQRQLMDRLRGYGYALTQLHPKKGEAELPQSLPEVSAWHVVARPT